MVAIISIDSLLSAEIIKKSTFVVFYIINTHLIIVKQKILICDKIFHRVMKMKENKFKEILKDLRLEKDVKQKDVARECDVSPQCISQLEAGTRSPTGTTLVALANYFNCSIDYLMGRTDEYYNLEKMLVQPHNEKEASLLANFRKLPKDYQAHICSYVCKLVGLHSKEK